MEDKDIKKVKNKQGKAKSRDNKVCTVAEDIYANKLAQGWTQRKSYVKAYPNKTNWKVTSLDIMASKLASKEKVKKRILFYTDKYKELNEKMESWSRGEAVKTLRFVVDINRKEVDRINEACEEEIDELLKLSQVVDSMEEQTKILKKVIDLRKMRRLSNINNQGIINASSELNKMHGYNEENINHSGSVIFIGEEELED